MFGMRDGVDGVMFGLIGAAVVAAAIGTLSSVPSVPSGASTAPASPAPAAVYDVDVAQLIPMLEAAVADVAEPEAAAEPEPEPQRAASAPPRDAPVLATVVTEPPAAPRRAPRPAQHAVLKPQGAAQASAKPKHPKCTIAPDPAIVPTGADSYEVRRAVIRRYASDWSKLDDLGWSAQHDDPATGKSDGLQIGGIKCGSDPYDAGFRSGDVIHSVNGRSVRSIPQALVVYLAIHDERLFNVEISRRGQRRTLRFALVEG